MNFPENLGEFSLKFSGKLSGSLQEGFSKFSHNFPGDSGYAFDVFGKLVLNFREKIVEVCKSVLTFSECFPEVFR